MNLRITLVLVFLISIFSVPADGATLFGGIEHNERLPAVNDSYQPEQAQEGTIPPSPMQYQGRMQQGMVSGQGLVPEPPGMQAAQPMMQAPQQNMPQVQWYQIPKAMAGKWVKRGDLTQSVTDLRTGISTPVNRFTEDIVTVSWGHQVDKYGNIWHGNIFPFERDGSTVGQQVRFIIVAQQAHMLSQNEIVSRTHSIIVESRYGNVTKVFQQESLNNYKVSEREIVNQSSNRDFTYEGSALRDGMLLSTFNKVAPFQPVATLRGVDLASSLEQYLRSVGQE